MNPWIENKIILTLILILILIGISGCGRSIQGCDFKPGVSVKEKSKPKEGEVQKESELESKLPVKVSPKGEIACSF